MPRGINIYLYVLVDIFYDRMTEREVKEDEKKKQTSRKMKPSPFPFFLRGLRPALVCERSFEFLRLCEYSCW